MNVVTVAFTIHKDNIVLLHVFMGFLLSRFILGVVAPGAHLVGMAEGTVAFLLAEIKVGLAIYNMEERVPRVANIGC